MTYKLLAAWLLVLAGGFCMPAEAQEQPLPDQERARIAAERSAAETRHAAEEKACYAKFAVNACLDEARARRRDVLNGLRRQELTLNDLERREKSAEKRRKLGQRATAEDQQQAQRSQALAKQQQREARAASKATERAATPEPAEGPRDARTIDRPAPAASPMRRASPPRQPDLPRSVNTTENRRLHEERLQEAQAHRERLAKRLADRDKPAARSLPVPP